MKRVNKKGLSLVVTTILLIALTMVLIGIVWGIVNNLIKKSTEDTNACFGIFEKVVLNSEYTCYNEDGLRFSISIGDVDVDEVLVGVSLGGESSTFIIKKTPSQINNLVMYPDGSTSIKLPSKNAGLTYVLDLSGAGFSGTPDSIEIAPVVQGAQCEVSDSLNEITRCLD